MPRARLLVLTLALLALMSAPAAAQRITSPYSFIDSRQYITIFGGRLHTGTGVVALGPTSGNIFGGQYGYRVSGPLVVELTVAYAPLHRQARDTTRLGPPDTTTFRPVGSANQGVLSAMAGLRFDVTGQRTWHHLQPYALIGFGGAFGTTGQNGKETSLPQDVRFSFGTSFAAQVGAGIEWYVTRRLGLRLDGRGTLWKLHTPSAFILREGTLPGSEWAQNASIVGGLSVHF